MPILHDLKGKYVYLAAPFSKGDKKQNVERSIKATNFLIDHGIYVYNPLLTYYLDLDNARTASFWYDFDKRWLQICHALVYLPGESVGVQEEIKYAAEHGIDIYAWEDIAPVEIITTHKTLKEEIHDQLRLFKTGAIRDRDDNKLDFEGFFSPIAIEVYAKYMHKHRFLPDGKMRASDNWQKGMPLESYIKSLWRHFFAVWKSWRLTHDFNNDDLCGVLFNTMGILHEINIKFYSGQVGGEVDRTRS